MLWRLLICWAAVALLGGWGPPAWAQVKDYYAVCPPAKIGGVVERKLSAAFAEYLAYKSQNQPARLQKAERLLTELLQDDPDNPVALNNLAAIKVVQGKLDKADTLLEQALDSLHRKPCMVQVNRVCEVNNICLAVEPVQVEGGGQDLLPLVKFNLAMVKQKLAQVGAARPRPLD